MNGYLSDDLLNTIAKKADKKILSLDIDKTIESITGFGILGNMSYGEIALTESSISIKDGLLSIPEYTGIAFQESFLKIISNYFGYIPTHRTVVSRGLPKNPRQYTSFFHKDNHSVEVLNIFIYLNNVDENSGPFCYIPKSHNSSARSCRPRNNIDKGIIDSYGRIPDEEMSKYYPKELWTPITGKRGTIIIADTNGLHKGQACPRSTP